VITTCHVKKLRTTLNTSHFTAMVGLLFNLRLTPELVFFYGRRGERGRRGWTVIVVAPLYQWYGEGRGWMVG
jgi:hypothetical protein